MGLPPYSRMYFINVIFSTALAVMSCGVMWFITLPIKRLSNQFFRMGVLVILKTQVWLLGATNLSKIKQNKGLFFANHRSILDTFILLAIIPNLKLGAKKQLFTVPFLGFLMRISKQIPIDLSDLNSIEKALVTIDEFQKNNIPVLVYPEMTRCTANFHGVQKFVQFPFTLAWNKNYLVTPVVLHNTDAAWPKKTYSLVKCDQIKFQILPSFHAKDLSSAEELKKMLHQKMSVCLESAL